MSDHNGCGTLELEERESAELPMIEADPLAEPAYYVQLGEQTCRAIFTDGTVRDVPARKVAIIGKAPSSCALAPYQDTSWEIWGLSNGAQNLPRWNRWFELHDLEAGKERWGKLCPEFWPWLIKDHGKPLYIQKPHPEMPHASIFPWERMLKRFGHYFNNSISEMMALAILDGYTHIALYGVDMAQSDPAMHNGQAEYQHQRPSCEHMLGIARGMGISVTVPAESDLLKCMRVYGFPGHEGEFVRKMKARRKELMERRDKMIQQMHAHQQQAREFEKAVAKFEGALEDNDYVIQRAQV